MKTVCPLCREVNSSSAITLNGKVYHLCPRCSLLFLNPIHHLAPAEEKQRYDLHNNDPDDPRYRAFLNQLVTPLLPYLRSGARGLDYGCGPGPALAQMMRARGFKMNIYDPFYAPYDTALSQQYDFITATEVVEHMHDPGVDFTRLYTTLKKGGVLGIMTRFRPDISSELSSWHYLRDDTHVSFYNESTFKYISYLWNLKILEIGNNIAIFRK